jgi:hypothetical protein
MKKNNRKSKNVKTAKAKPDCAPRTCSATGTPSYLSLGKIEEDIARELRNAGNNVLMFKRDPKRICAQIMITIPKRKKKGR